MLIHPFRSEKNLAIEDYSKMSITELDAAFILAVQEHRSEKMQELIEAGANVNTPIPIGKKFSYRRLLKNVDNGIRCCFYFSCTRTSFRKNARTHRSRS